MNMRDIIQKEWGWLGFEVDQVLEVNAFGNVLFSSMDGQRWRICPKDLLCEPIASREADYRLLLQDADFQLDWKMGCLVEMARDTIGDLHEGYSYCLKLWTPLGGEYVADNIAQAPTDEVIASAGHVAFQIKDVPNGGQIQLKGVD